MKTKATITHDRLTLVVTPPFDGFEADRPRGDTLRLTWSRSGTRVMAPARPLLTRADVHTLLDAMTPRSAPSGIPWETNKDAMERLERHACIARTLSELVTRVRQESTPAATRGTR